VAEITHQEARGLIQSGADRALDRSERARLGAHLEECRDCRAYAGEVKALEDLLRRTMQHHWVQSPAPLPIASLTAGARQVRAGLLGSAQAVRAAAIAAILVLVFGTWQFSRSTGNPPRIATIPLPVPTPSTHLTSTGNPFQGCSFIRRRVGADDTLVGIARQYGVSKADLMLLNRMKTETLEPAAEIWIPRCNSTATDMTDTPAGTITITPQLEPYTSTPG